MTGPRRDDALAGGETVVSPRGIGLAGAGGALLVAGIGLGSTGLTLVALAVLACVGLSAAWIWLSLARARRAVVEVRRHANPPTLTAGLPGEVIARLVTRGGARPRVREQAAPELTGGGPTRAQVSSMPDGVQLRYRLTPQRRGRWPLGPLLVRAEDPFGLAWADRAVGAGASVAVWPPVTDLTHATGALLGAAETARDGARLPSPDDAALRDYRDGDDLRRVHWPSSARRGTLLVRSEEAANRSPATVMGRLPTDPEAVEAAIRAVASIALGVVDCGHPVHVRLGEANLVAGDSHARGRDVARSVVLDAMVDLAPAPDEEAGDADLARHAAAAAAAPVEHGIVFAVLDAAADSTLAALAPLGARGGAFALVSPADGGRPAAERTAARLAAHGWTAHVAGPGETLEESWTALVGTARP
ncbi:DUF58 domain-containing protein [Demequina pelophila]|uniref:DUF58 domain-containing protein n=1 Tax=Demequina pelophila TaxID=1638984 RepID=UPI00078117A5|nr:DUF58 domain-containing protein [Demequina pelophila]